MNNNFPFRMAGVLAACLFIAGAAGGRNADDDPVRREGDRLKVGFTLDGGGQGLTANEQLVVTPVIVHGDERQQLAPVVFTGRIRQKVNERRERLYGIPAEPEGSFGNFVVRRNRSGLAENEVLYTGVVPYERWMGGGRLMLYRDIYGCAGSSVSLPPLVAAEIAEPLQPRLSFLIPDADTVKRRSEQITAVVHFPQGRSVLLRGFSDNRRQLERIDSLTARLAGGDTLTVEGIFLKGYASPEDTYAFNTRLAANRVRSIRRYLEENPAVAGAEFVTASVPEDWDSLRRWVAASDWAVKDRVLAVIDSVADPDARDAGIWSIDGGRTYLRLLQQVYPQLRRVDYRIAYTIPQFTPEECRRIVHTHPEWLSVGEMCRLAASYPEDSPERAYVCAVAVEYYPDDPCACNNMAFMALQRGDVQTARQCLSRCKDDPRVQNTLGVLCVIDGDRAKAERCFSLAAEGGSDDAAYNLAHLDELEYVW